MTTAGDNPAAADPGLIVLVTLLRFNGVGADAEQIRHRLGGIPVGVSEMVRVAKDLDLKALVHRSLSTLDVLVVGLVAITAFEAILGVLRTYLFAHTTNRIDVELGARLYRHLVALPLAYFQTRRVGDSVARVRELENIRNFLTSSALTLVIDLVFTSVALAVMYFYSPVLTWIV